jgi:hypothetical protein
VIVNPGVTSNADQRINVGLFNPGRSEITVFVAVGDGTGEVAEIIQLEVSGRSWAQKAVSSRFENGVIGWGCAQSSCNVYPWVVTVNNQSNDGVLTQPIVYDPPD